MQGCTYVHTYTSNKFICIIFELQKKSIILGSLFCSMKFFILFTADFNIQYIYYTQVQILLDSTQFFNDNIKIFIIIH